MKKAFVLVLALAMVASVAMTGCGSKEETSTTPAATVGDSK